MFKLLLVIVALLCVHSQAIRYRKTDEDAAYDAYVAHLVDNGFEALLNDDVESIRSFWRDDDELFEGKYECSYCYNVAKVLFSNCRPSYDNCMAWCLNRIEAFRPWCHCKCTQPQKGDREGCPNKRDTVVECG